MKGCEAYEKLEGQRDKLIEALEDIEGVAEPFKEVAWKLVRSIIIEALGCCDPRKESEVNP